MCILGDRQVHHYGDVHFNDLCLEPTIQAKIYIAKKEKSRKSALFSAMCMGRMRHCLYKK